MRSVERGICPIAAQAVTLRLPRTSVSGRDSGKSKIHGNKEITETVIFVQCRYFAKMPLFYVFYNNMLFLISISWSLLCDFNTKNITFASATKGRVLCYLLAQYVTEYIFFWSWKPWVLAQQHVCLVQYGSTRLSVKMQRGSINTAVQMQ